MDNKEMHSANETLKKEILEMTERLKKTEDEKTLSCTNSQEEINKLNQELTEMQTKHAVLLDEVQEERKSLQTKIETLQKQLGQSEDERMLLKNRVTELGGDIEIADLESDENKKDKAEIISKLKIIVQRSVKLDQKRQETIANLEKQLKTATENSLNIQQTAHKTNKENELEKREFSQKPDNNDILLLQAKIKELEQLIEKNEASKELISKNETLNKMLKKSNNLYAQLLEENQNLISEIKEMKQNPSNNQKENESEKKDQQFNQLVLSKGLSLDFNDNEDEEHQTTEEDVEHHPTTQQSNKGKGVMDTYLKRTLMQFFLQDEQTRVSLIPMILELVGCTPQQIATAQRQWERTHQIAKKTGFFGF